MKCLDPYFQFSDPRGVITGIVNQGEWQEINFVQSAAGVVRGGHFHRETVELFFIVEGEVRVSIADAQGAGGSERVVGQGDVVLISPGEYHTFHCITPCRWINVLSKRMDREAPDIVVPEWSTRAVSGT